MSVSGHGMGVVKKQRLKREDHTHVKHDDCFSDWTVLVGPTDWKEHAAGKIPDRFRISNLPSNYNGTGLYELGVTPPAWLPPQRSSSQDTLKPQDIVVVYLGCAENVHQRLLRYGQSGTHLEGARSTRLFAVRNDSTELVQNGETRSNHHERKPSGERLASPPRNGGCTMNGHDEVPLSGAEVKKSGGGAFDQALGSRSPSRGPRLFSEVFALGCSIAFRWAVAGSKADAERAEMDLVEVFDYAWKRGGNFRQRSPDILSKIVMGGALGSNDSSYSSCFGDHSTSRTWLLFHRSRPGVPIAARKPCREEDSRASSRADIRVGDLVTLFRATPGGKSPKLSEFTKFDIPLDRCGAVLANSTYPCNALPVKGGKRCYLHKDLRTKQFKPERVAHTNHVSSPAHPDTPSSHPLHIPEGAESPILPGPEPTPPSSCFSYLITPGLISTPSRSSTPEPKRRGSLSFTSWLRTSEIRMAKSREWTELNWVTDNSSEPGCPRRSGTYSSILTTCEESQYESPSRSRREICGLRLDDGTVCPDPPRPDRKRCEAHKGMRNPAPRSPGSMSPRSSAMSPAMSNNINNMRGGVSLNSGFF